MERVTENKIVLIKRKTRLEDLIIRYNTINQAKFYIEHMGADFSDYIAENEEYIQAIENASKILNTIGIVQVLDRTFLPNYIFGPNDLVVAIGQDGLVANTLKYLNNQLLIGVNPDPKRWDGILLPFVVSDLSKIIPETFKNQRKIKEVTMAKAELNDGQYLYAVNDFFIGQKSHVSARYEIKIRNQKEFQSSSGIIVSTGLGSTGWLKSVLTGASSIVNHISDKKIITQENYGFEWGSNYLYFSVREPFLSKTSHTGLVFGRITAKDPLAILSQMLKMV